MYIIVIVIRVMLIKLAICLSNGALTSRLEKVFAIERRYLVMIGFIYFLQTITLIPLFSVHFQINYTQINESGSRFERNVGIYLYIYF